MSANDPYTAPRAELETGAEPARPFEPDETLNPWFAIWLRPRAVTRQLMWRHSTGMMLLLAALQGVSDSLNQASIRNAGDQLSLPGLLGVTVIGGIVGGLIGLYLFSALLKWTGGWLGGRGSAEDIRVAYAWSAIPAIWALLLWIPELALFGEELFTAETPRLNQTPWLWQSLIAFSVVELVIGIWGFVVFLKCLGEAQGFSAWRALGNSLLAGLVLLIPFVIIGIVVGVMTGLSGV